MDKIEKINKSMWEAEFEYAQSLNEMPANQEEEKMIYDAFIAGAEWQKSKMLKDAIEVTVQSPILGPPMVCCIANGCSDGDKVRIVVLKGEE